MDKITLLDIIQDGLIDIKTANLVDKKDKVKEITERLLDVTYDYKIGNHLDQLEVGK